MGNIFNQHHPNTESLEVLEHALSSEAYRMDRFVLKGRPIPPPKGWENYAVNGTQ